MEKSKRLWVVIWLILCALIGLNLPSFPFINEFVYKNLGVREIIIEGSSKVEASKVESIFSNKIWFSLDEEEIKKEFKQTFPFIKELKIEKPEFRKVKVTITEYQPFALVSIKNKKVFITRDGVILDKKFYPEINEKNLIKIVVNDENISKSKIKSLDTLNNKFCKKFNVEKYIIYRNQIACILKDGKNFIFSVDNIDKNIKKAEKFLKKVENIDRYKVLDFRFNYMVIAKEQQEDGKK